MPPNLEMTMHTKPVLNRPRFHLSTWFAAGLISPALIGWSTAATSDRDLARRILNDSRLDEVRRMALELLSSGLNAGTSYAEVWIRDLNTFIVPALEVSPPKTIRDALINFFHFQAPDGNIIDGYVPAAKADVDYRYRTSPTRPELRAHKNTVETDQESSLVQAVCRYVRVTGDRTILDEPINDLPVRERLERALRYPLEHRFSVAHGLIWGATTADWGDVQPEHPWGVELDDSSHRAVDIYDNALLAIAIQDFVNVVAVNDPTKAAAWSQTRSNLVDAIRQHLWDPQRQKFTAHLYLDGSPFPPEFDESRVYYHGGTTVAMEARVLTPEEIGIAYGQMLANVRLAGAATIGLTLYPPYPEGAFKNPSMKPFGYQNGGDWTWFGARTVRQLAQAGLVRESYRELQPMLDRVLKHQGFFEWWTPANAPMGAGKFRGAAGVLCQAIDELRAWAGRQPSE